MKVIHLIITKVSILHLIHNSAYCRAHEDNLVIQFVLPLLQFPHHAQMAILKPCLHCNELDVLANPTNDFFLHVVRQFGQWFLDD